MIVFEVSSFCNYVSKVYHYEVIFKGEGVITAGYVEWLYANCVIKQKQLHPCVYMLTYY